MILFTFEPFSGPEWEYLEKKKCVEDYNGGSDWVGEGLALFPKRLTFSGKFHFVKMLLLLVFLGLKVSGRKKVLLFI